MQGTGVMGSLYLPVSFAVNLKLLLEKRKERKDRPQVSCPKLRPQNWDSGVTYRTYQDRLHSVF